MAKNAGDTVAALLAKAPAPPARAQPAQLDDIPAEPPAPEPEPERAPDITAPLEPATPGASAAPAAPPTAQQPSPEPNPPPASSRAESKAPPTLRLAQTIAETLRTAWLREKRDRVLLTYQEFAGEVITAGLGSEHRETPAVYEESLSTGGSPVPRTLRLAQPTAEALRAAWLHEKRDRVLLTYQEFAGEVITAGLRQERQPTPRQ